MGQTTGVGRAASAPTLTVQRLTGANIETKVLEVLGYSASTAAPWVSQARFMLRLNEYLHRIPQKVTELAREKGIIGIGQLLRFNMWKDESAACSSSTTTGVQYTSATPYQLYFPLDYDVFISLWDVNHKRSIPVVRDVARYHKTLKNLPDGPPEAVEILGFETVSSNWRRKAYLYPNSLTLTPNVILTYYRLPVAMDSSGTNYVDIDPKWEQLLVAGLVAELGRGVNALAYQTYSQAEAQMLNELIACGEVTSGTV